MTVVLTHRFKLLSFFSLIIIIIIFIAAVAAAVTNARIETLLSLSSP